MIWFRYHVFVVVGLLEASKLVLFARKQTKRSAKIGVFQESGSKKISAINFRKSSIQWRKTRRRNQKIGIVSFSSRKEEETLINKKLPPPFLTCATASHHTTPLSPNRAVRRALQTPMSPPPTPTTIISPSDRSVATAAGRAFGGTVG